MSPGVETTAVEPVRRRRRNVLIVVGLLALAYILRRGCASEAPDQPAGAAAARPVPVITAAARTGDMRVFLDGIGSVTPLAAVTVRTRVDGELKAVHFREGDTVHAGDLLAEIDPRPFEVLLAQAQGQLARDGALLANARVDLQRFENLLKSGIVAHQEYDTQAALVRQYEGAVQSDQAQIDNAKLQLVYARVTAPIGGRLGLRLVDPGNIVHVTDANGLVVITQIRPIAVVFTIPEDDLPRLLERLKGDEHPTVDALDREGRQRLATGSVLTVDNTIDPGTGTVRVKAEFPNDDDALFPNQFVNARLLVEVHGGATLVPEVAVQHGAEGTFVYVVAPDHTVAVRRVQVGVTEGDEASITSGVAPGELVVVDGAEGLRPGAAVSPRDPNAPPPGR